MLLGFILASVLLFLAALDRLMDHAKEPREIWLFRLIRPSSRMRSGICICTLLVGLMCLYQSKIEDKEQDGKLDQVNGRIETMTKTLDHMAGRIEEMAKRLILLAGVPVVPPSSAEIAEALGVHSPVAAHIIGTFAMNDFGGLGKGL
jgi:hypothetical protein